MTLPEGWLTPEEAKELERLATDQVVLEIGAWLGLSTVTMARVARHVVSVDHHRGSSEHQQGGACFDEHLVDEESRIDTWPQFWTNIRTNGVRDRVTPIIATTEQIGPLLRSSSFDLVFVDGAHETSAVARDGELAFRVVRPTGAVAFHDFNLPSVQFAIEMLHLAWPAVLVGSLAVFPAEPNK